MALESVALIPKCAECEAVWLPAAGERWLAHLGGDEFDEPAELVFYCPGCAEREFGQPASAPLTSRKRCLTNAEEVPSFRHALELMLASILELDPRAGDEVLDRA